jgi:hypothetical protein
MRPTLSAADLLNILAEVKYPSKEFVVLEEDDRLFLQAQYWERCVDTGALELQKTRKWVVSRYATKSEVIQTAFKAVLTSAEHQVREHFKYRGRAVFGPHFNVDQLWEIAGLGPNKREEP